MEHLFYLYGVFLVFTLIVRLIFIKDYVKMFSWIEKIAKIQEKINEGKKDKSDTRKLEQEIKDELIPVVLTVVLLLIYSLTTLFWILIGLLTSQWILFAGMFVLSSVIAGLKKLTKFQNTVFVHVSMILISLGFYLAILLNKYHFHVDLVKVIFG